VLVDGAPVSAASVGNDEGWLALPVAGTRPGPAKLTFAVDVDRTRGGPPENLPVCIAAEARQ
jgi:hypothetical protein